MLLALALAVSRPRGDGAPPGRPGAHHMPTQLAKEFLLLAKELNASSHRSSQVGVFSPISHHLKRPFSSPSSRRPSCNRWSSTPLLTSSLCCRGRSSVQQARKMSDRRSLFSSVSERLSHTNSSCSSGELADMLALKPAQPQPAQPTQHNPLSVLFSTSSHPTHHSLSPIPFSP